MKKCSRCGFEADENFCPNCGIAMSDINQPVRDFSQESLGSGESNVQVSMINNTDNMNQEGDAAVTVVKNESPITVKKKKLSKKWIIILSVIAAVVVIAGIVIGVVVHKHATEQEYAENLNMFATEVLYGSQDAETQCNLVMSVWHDAIWKNTSEEDTKKYVSGAKDFNDALSKLYADADVQTTVADLSNNKKSVDSLMEKLKEPPEKYKDCYNAAVELYSKYSSFVNHAIDPSGSYNSYSEEAQDLDSEVVDLYNKLNTLLPSLN